MAAHGDPERYFRETADRICDGAEDELVARLTSEALDMMEKAVTNPDRYQVLARLAPQALMGVLAEHRPHLEDDVARAVWEALKREDDALEAILAAKKANAAAGAATDYAKIYATQAAKGVTEILQRQNVALVDHLASLWYRVAGNAVTRAILGDSRRAVMEDAVRALADGGLETVDYRSRRRTSVDAATRRHIVTQANQARNRLLTQRCSQYGCELVMTSAHYGARPDHAVWQGKAYGLHGPVTVDGVRYPGLAASTGYGSVTGLAGANCRHTMTPYVPGLSKLPRTDFSAEERLHGMTSDEYYGATQVQHRLEREVRKYKRRIALGQERGLDMAADRAALGRAQGRVRQWCKQNSLPRRYDLERAYGVAGQPRALGPQRAYKASQIRTRDKFLTAHWRDDLADEWGGVFDSQGNLVGKIRRGHGGAVTFTCPDGHSWEQLRPVHTHPGAIGGTFSVGSREEGGDIFHLTDANCLGYDARCNEGVYSISRTVSARPREFYLAAREAELDAREAAYNAVCDRWERQGMSFLAGPGQQQFVSENKEAMSDIMHEWFKDNAAHYGYRYSFSRRE